ncbi:BspA family leucine-rich repeat surface protein [Aequorivita viscosa]|uniref:Por secretion system C-terminal sorting domain-containing protein n=1 Tax=Aequorivita viscosa TaxID=797419 RepID=A0A1M5ZZ46_9FLAO|nr:BspA family leucine-rich repeat surface protein [Aequorivita viscosa]SDW08298.1 Por secretion system C-terminal sorting domain-containing protein [Aequorivita viscosa]SHI29502.1 Por secretion system C-terminal sorting domain-containing protein [Aequorivita viscosa]
MNKIIFLLTLCFASIQGSAQEEDYFITTWKTDNVSAGSSNATSITIPIGGSGTYSYEVSWKNDGNWVFVSAPNITHDYGIAGTYTVAIRGVFPQIIFGGGQGDHQKILSIEQWGSNPWSSMNGAFAGCINLVSNATDSPDLTNVTDMSYMFWMAKLFDQDIGNWNVSSVTNMSYMLYNAQSFNQDLGSWDVSNVTDLEYMFINTPLSITNYDALLNGWSSLTLQNGVVFDAIGLHYCRGEAARTHIINTFGWTIDDYGLSCPSTENFITTWKTDNPGTSNTTSITIPTTGTGYNYDVDWNNDGVFDDFGVTGDATHDYGTAGTYTVAIRGYFPRIYFNNSGDREKIMSIEQWGPNPWSSMERAFYGCSNLVNNSWESNPNFSRVSDMSYMFADATSLNQHTYWWNVSNVTNMSNMFAGATAFNLNMNNWDVSNVTNMSNMFDSATAFNQNLGNWDIGNVTDMQDMFLGATLSGSNYDATLIGWATDSSGTADDGVDDIPSNITFNGGYSSYCLGEAARNNLTNGNGWEILDNGQVCPSNYFITTWKTTSNGESITIPTFPGETYNYTVDWGDTNNTAGHTGNATHNYVTAGTYTIKIYGNFPRIYFNNNYASDHLKIQSIDQWGTNTWSSMNGAFYGCDNLISNATDFPDLSMVTNTAYMFSGALKFNGDLSNCDVSNVTDMSFMFNDARLFNQDIGNWDVSNVTNMSNLLSYAYNFSQDLSSWDVSNVTNMAHLFEYVYQYNHDLADWNVGNVTNMSSMFRGAEAFNQDISNWNVSNVTDMSYMLQGAGSFNQDIGNWDVSNVTNMAAMFTSTGAFNQDISNWDVSNVTNMSYMFAYRGIIDHDFGKWDVSNVTNMNAMFFSFGSGGLTTESYDSLLIGWSKLTLQSGVSFGGGISTYCAGETARATIINNFGWTITDNGKNCLNLCGSLTEYTIAGGWNNGFPDTSKMAVFIDDYNTNLGSIDACIIQINHGATLTVSEGTTIRADKNIIINGNLVFLSSNTGNGELASMSADAIVVGDATVQRYLSSRRSYRVVSSAVTTTTSINANWQEGANNTSTDYGSNQDPNPGYGTHITGSTIGENGFDASIAGISSMYTVDVANQEFQPVANTNVGTLSAGQGYLLFIRGDRSIDMANSMAPPTETVLRATGQLMVGDQSQNFTSPSDGAIVQLGNPYQSAVNMNAVLGASTNVNLNQYYVYDPALADYGAYVTLTLPGGTNTSGSATNQFLQPGQGVQVASLTSGPVSVVFHEADKTPGEFTATNATGNTMVADGMVIGQLYTLENYNNGESVHDSFGILFADGNSNALTPEDAVKPMNFGENLGIDHNGKYLSLERRALPEGGENLPLFINGYQHTNYTLKMELNNLENVAIYLDDYFNGTSTLLEQGIVAYSFSIDPRNPESIASDRFALNVGERLSVDDNGLLSGITLYPNPMADQVTLGNPKNVTLENASIYDITGRLIKTVDLTGVTPKTIIDVSTLSSATYIVVINGKDGQVSQLMVKE